MEIEKLTEEQISKLTEYRDKWLKIGLSTEKADHALAEKAVDEAYEMAGLKAPKIKIWLMSPIQGVLGAEYLKLLIKKIKIDGVSSMQMGAQVKDKVWNQVRDHVGVQVGNQVVAQVRNQVVAQVREQVMEQVKEQVGAQVRNQVKEQVVEQVWEQVGAQVGAQVEAQVMAQVVGQVRDQVETQVVGQVRDQVVEQVWEQVRDQVKDQVVAQVGEQVEDQVIAQVMAQVMAQVGVQVGNQLGNQVKEQVAVQVMEQVWNQVGNQVKEQVMAQIKDQVGVQVGNQVGTQVRDQVWNQVMRAGYGSYDAFWLGFYDFFKQELNLEFCDKLTPLMKLSENCGWWWPFEGAVILTEKPNSILRDQNNRLHSMDKMALSYPDGWGVYAIHGVRVPEKYILTPADKINPEEVMKESNTEIRMAVIRKCGFAHFKNNLKHKVISASNGNELIEFELENEKVRGLKVSWLDKHSFKETILPVARTKEEFKEWASQIGVDFIPDDINDCEQVRKFTVKMRPSESFSIET